MNMVHEIYIACINISCIYKDYFWTSFMAGWTRYNIMW